MATKKPSPRRPEGVLTSAQFEILEAVWSGEPSGSTLAQLWQRVAAKRPVARTTVLNQVDRLVARGWLTRDSATPARFCAAMTRERAASLLAKDFVDNYFGGSSASLLTSVLGSRPVSKTEVAKLRKLLRDNGGKR